VKQERGEGSKRQAQDAGDKVQGATARWKREDESGEMEVVNRKTDNEYRQGNR
jgi:hypothetical protein